MAKYDAVWSELKKQGCVELTVSKSAAFTIINGIKLAKTTENVARRHMGLIGWSKLVIVKTPISATMLRVKLSFLYETKL